MKNTLDRHRFITNISLPWWTLNESTDVLRSARAATFFINIFFDEFFLIFISSLSSRFCWGVVVVFNKRKRERAREDKFSSLPSNTTKRRRNTCSVCAVKVAQTCDIKTDHQNRRRTRFVYPPRGRFLLCTWSRFDISTRARGIYFIMVFFSFFFLCVWCEWLFFLFSSCKKTEEVCFGLSSFGLSRKKRRRRRRIFFKDVFSLLFLLSFLLSFLFARTRTLLIESSPVILQQRTIKL